MTHSTPTSEKEDESIPWKYNNSWDCKRDVEIDLDDQIDASMQISEKVKQLDMYGCMLDHSIGLLLGVAEDCAITTN